MRPEPLKRTHSPILLQWDNLIDPYTEDPLLPEDLNDLDAPVYLAPRYYIKVFSPNTYNTNSSLSSSPTIYHIPRVGLLGSTLRLRLRPSVGYGANSCYRVEYWQWEKIVVPTNYSLSGIPNRNTRARDKPQHKHSYIRTEHWYIPSADGSLNLNYDSFMLNQGMDFPSMVYPYPHPKRRDNYVVRVPMLRHDSDVDMGNIDFLDPPHNIEAFDVIRVRDENGMEWQDYGVIEVDAPTPVTLLTGEKVVRATGIGWGSTYPRPATKYYVEYVKPYTLKDILFLPEDRATNLYPIRTIHHGYPWSI